MGVHCNFLEEDQSNDSGTRDANHRLPNDRHTHGESIPNLGPKRLFEVANDRDCGVGDLRTIFELADEFHWKLFL